MFCFKCGYELNEGDAFCSECGIKIRERKKRRNDPIVDINETEVSDLNPEKKESEKSNFFMWAMVIGIIVIMVALVESKPLTAEETVKKYVENLDEFDIDGALEYTNFEKSMDILKYFYVEDIPYDYLFMNPIEIYDELVKVIETEYKQLYKEINVIDMISYENEFDKNISTVEANIEILNINNENIRSLIQFNLNKINNKWLIDINTINTMNSY